MFIGSVIWMFLWATILTGALFLATIPLIIILSILG